LLEDMAYVEVSMREPGAVVRSGGRPRLDGGPRAPGCQFPQPPLALEPVDRFNIFSSPVSSLGMFGLERIVDRATMAAQEPAIALNRKLVDNRELSPGVAHDPPCGDIHSAQGHRLSHDFGRDQYRTCKRLVKWLEQNDVRHPNATLPEQRVNPCFRREARFGGLCETNIEDLGRRPNAINGRRDTGSHSLNLLDLPSEHAGDKGTESIFIDSCGGDDDRSNSVGSTVTIRSNPTPFPARARNHARLQTVMMRGNENSENVISGSSMQKEKGKTVLNDEVRAFLNEKRFAVLATIKRDGSPQQTVMWYELQGDHIMMNTAEGRAKAYNFRRDARVSICVEDEYRFVAISGNVELVEDREQSLADIMRLAVRYHGAEKAESMRDGFNKDQRVTMKISIDNVVTNGF